MMSEKQLKTCAGFVIAAVMTAVMAAITVGSSGLAAPARAEPIRALQAALDERSCEPGPVDGLWGRMTARALMRFNLASGSGITRPITEADIAKLTGSTAQCDSTAERERRTDLIIADYANNAFGDCAGISQIRHYQRTLTRAVSSPTGVWQFITSINDAGSQFLHAHDAARFEAFIADLVQAAEQGAYTQLDFRRDGNLSNPAHNQSTLLLNVAYFVSIVDHFDLWKPGQRETMIAWGDILRRQSRRTRGPGRGQIDPSVRWPDTVAMQAAANITWGIITHKISDIEAGIDDILSMLRRMHPDGPVRAFIRGPWTNAWMPDKNLYLQDHLIGFMVLAAHAAHYAGRDFFEERFNGTNLHESIAWHLDAIEDPQGFGGLSAKQDMHFFRGSGGFAYWGWVEPYIALFPDSDNAERMREMSRRALGFRTHYRGAAGNTSCLFRGFEPPSRALN
ncbi:MAG: putative peptidoglycan binding domain [Saliniramus fredricksonii]|uniref:Putative peptidoglycan binding domain n=1 Tax=Saliniramus fredricksonii TaxID=1653334 RepID=A0A0P7Y1V3_9HYPH|nr:peptidoglycan-binding domain-containing protein [Saliniramus fredricksonii]KPQ10342.1 MAG: putative peptidoglycan binding domain [Saliniramus fredricksonii]SCC79686.1 hypothetical protein GA0071312_1095 [Saliniramus fredricksonii]